MDSRPKFERDNKRNGQQTLDRGNQSGCRHRDSGQAASTGKFKASKEMGEKDKQLSSSLNYACNITGILRNNLLIASLCEKELYVVDAFSGKKVRDLISK